MASYVRCDWATAAAETRAKYPDATAFHDEHGDDLSTCDSWVCACGNEPHKEGFHPCHADGTPDDAPDDFLTLWLCDRCGVILNSEGEKVGERAALPAG